MKNGIDVSKWQGVIDWKSVKTEFFLAAVYAKHSEMILALQNG